MSTPVDTKVVEMKFDNSNFQQNTAQTLTTLEKLKQALDFRKHKDSFDDLTKGAEQARGAVINLGDSFGEMAKNVAGLELIKNVIDDIYASATRMVKALSIDNLAAGWSKYEQKTGNVQSIMNATGLSMEKVNVQLDRLMRYSDETSFSFTEMAAALSQFAMAGADVETAVPAIMGIANATAFAGKGAFEFQRTIRNLSQSFSTGYLNLMDWKSIELAQTNSVQLREELIRAGIELGRIKEGEVDVNNFRDTLKDKWADQDVMQLAFGRFAEFSEEAFAVADEYGVSVSRAMDMISDGTESVGEKAFRAAQECKSFADVLNYIKDSVSTSWLRTWENIFGTFEDAKAFWTDLGEMFYGIFGKPTEELEAWIEALMGSPWDQVYAQVETLGMPIEDFQNRLIEAAVASHTELQKISKDQLDFNELVNAGWIDKDTIISVIHAYNNSLQATTVTTEEAIQAQENLKNNVIDTIIGVYDNGRKRMELMAKAGLDYATVQGVVNQVWDGQRINYELLNELTAQNTGLTEEQVAVIQDLCKSIDDADGPWKALLDSLYDPRSGSEIFLDTILNTLEGLTGILDMFRAALVDTFGIPVEDARQFLIFLNYLSQEFLALGQDSENLYRTFSGFFAIFGIIGDVIGAVINVALTTFGQLIGDADVSLLDLTASVGDSIVAFREWINENGVLVSVLQSIVDGITFVVNAIRGWIDSILQLPEVQAAVANIAYAFEDLGNKISEFFSSGDISIKNFLKIWKKSGDEVDGEEGLLSKLATKFDEISKLPLTTAEKIRENIKAVIASVREGTAQLWDAFVASISDISSSIQGFITTVSEAFAGIHWGRLIGLAALIGIFVTITKVAKAITILANPFGAIADTINKVGTAIAENLKAQKLKTVATAVREIALAVALLAGSLKIMSTIDPSGLRNAWTGLLQMTLLVGALAALVAILGKITGNVPQLSISLLGFGLCISILVKSLKTISELDTGSVLESVGVLNRIMICLGIVMAGLILVSKVVEGFAPNLGIKITNTFGGLAVALIAFSVSLKIIVDVLKDLAKADLSKLTIEKIGILAGCMVGLALLSRLCGNIQSVGAAAAIIALAFALKLMMNMVQSIKIKDIKQWFTDLAGLAGLIPVLFILLQGLQFAGGAALKAGSSLLLISVALGILVGVIKLFGMIPDDQIQKGTKAVFGMGLMFAGLIAITKLANKDMPKLATFLLAFSTSLIIMAGVMTVMSFLSMEDIGKGLLVISVLSGLMIALVAVARHARNADKSLKQIMGIMITLTAFMVIVSLPFVDITKALEACAGMALVLVAIGALMLMAGKTTALPNLKDMSPLLVVIAGIGAIVGILAGIMSAVGVSPEVLLASAGAMTLVMLALSPLCLAMGKAGIDAAKAIPAMAPLGIAVGGVAVIVGILGGIMSGLKVDPWTLLASAGAITLVVLALCPLMLAMSAAGELGSAAIINAAALDIALVVIGACVGIVAYVFQKAGVTPETAISTAISLGIFAVALAASVWIFSKTPPGTFMSVLEGVGGMILVVGAIAALMWALGQLLKPEDIQPGIDVLNTIAWGIGSFVSNLISGGIFGSLPKVGEALGEFFDNVTGALGNVDGETFKNAAELVEALGAMAIGQAISDFLSLFTGGNDWATFGTGLGEFGQAIKEFSDACADVNEEGLKKGADGTKVLAEANDAIPNSGLSLLSMLIGDNTWTTFGTGLAEYGLALAHFSEQCAKIKGGALLVGVQATKNLAEAEKAIPNGGLSVLSAFIGDNNWATFKVGLPEYGAALAYFSEQCAKIKMSAMAIGIAATQGLVDIANKIPAGGGVKQFFTGDTNWAMLKTGLGDYGKALADFYNAIKDIKRYPLKAAVDATDLLAEAAKKLPSKDEKRQTWGEFGTGLDVYASGLKTFLDTVQNIPYDDACKAVSLSEGLISVFGLLEGNPLATGSTDWNTVKLELLDLAVALSGFISEFKPIEENITTVGLTIEEVKKIIAMAQDMNNINLSPVDAISTKLSNLANAIDKYKELNIQQINTVNESVKSIDFSSWDQFVYKLNSALGNLTIQNGKLATALASAADKNKSEVLLAFTNLGTSVADGFIAGIMTQHDRMVEKVRNVATETYDEFKKSFDYYFDPVTMASYVITISAAQVNSLKQNMFEVVKAATNTSTDDIKKSFYILGNNIIEGMCIGMSNSQYKLDNKVAEVSQRLLNKFETRLRISSPSKETMWMGEMLAQGIVVGINQNASGAYRAADQFGEGILDAWKNGMTIHSPSKDAVENTDKNFCGAISAAIKKYSPSSIKEAYNYGKETIKKYIQGFTDGNQISLEAVGAIFEDLLMGYLGNVDSQKIINELYGEGLNPDQLNDLYASFGVGSDASATLQQAKKEFDSFFEDYKKGRIDQSEFDQRYTQLFEIYTKDQINILEYGQGKLVEYTEKTFEEVNKNYEKKLSDIQKKMDDTKNKIQKSFESSFTFETFKTQYDEGLKEITDVKEKNDEEIYDIEWERDQKIKKLEKEREKQVKALKTEDSWYVKKIDKDIADIRKKADERLKVLQEENEQLEHKEHLYKRDYKESGAQDDSIIGVKFADDLKLEKDMLKQYNAEIAKLRQNTDYEPLIELIGSKSREEGWQLAKYFNSLTKDQLDAIVKDYTEIQNLSTEGASLLYAPEVQAATEEFVLTALDTLSTLPSAALSIGAETIMNLAAGFSSETKKTLETIKMDASDIYQIFEEALFPDDPEVLFRIQQREAAMKPEIECTTVINYDEERAKHEQELHAWGALPIDAEIVVDWDSFKMNVNDEAASQVVSVAAVLDPQTSKELTASIEVDNQNVTSSVNSMSSSLGDKMDNTTNELQTMNEKMNSLIEATSKETPIYLDSGALVGAMSSDVNDTMGFNLMMSSRTGG